jgi:hypothetical protein
MKIVPFLVKVEKYLSATQLTIERCAENVNFAAG